MTERFNIRITKQYLNFCSSHFLVFEDGTRENLHGHNYKVECLIEGVLPNYRDLYIDFRDVKPIVRQICDDLDHVVLLQTENPNLVIKQSEQEIKFSTPKDKISEDGSNFLLPRRDVVLLPIRNTTSELLAKFIMFKTLEQLNDKYGDVEISKIDFAVEEAPGQSASYILTFDKLKKISEILNSKLV